MGLNGPVQFKRFQDQHGKFSHPGADVEAFSFLREALFQGLTDPDANGLALFSVDLPKGLAAFITIHVAEHGIVQLGKDFPDYLPGSGSQGRFVDVSHAE
jgi:hypothetical protein